MAQKFGDIINRVEEVRQTLGLNKSRFSARVGMKAQTYNNFVGSQGSKPNIELIHGIVCEFNVNPMWLLNGTGPTFRGYEPGVWPMYWLATLGPKGESAKQGAGHDESATLTRFKNDLDRVLEPTGTGAMKWQSREFSRDSHIRHAVQVLLHHFVASPDETATLVMGMLCELRRLADEVETARRPNAALTGSSGG